MALPSPNLDDRTFEELVEQARSRIPTLCPQWTDFNPSDPGMTLVELMAWMTELLIYRINRVPDKSYVEFLNLMGVRLRPPQAARTWVIFTTAAGANQRDLPVIDRGARLSTAGKNAAPVGFETTAPLNVTAAKIVKVGAAYKEDYQTIEVLDNGALQRFSMFGGDKAFAHCLYLGDADLKQIESDMNLKLHLTVSTESDADIQLEWECWNGRQWEVIVPFTDETQQWRQSGTILFESLPKMEQWSFQGHTSCWLRACLISTRGLVLPLIENLQRSFLLKPDHGRLPDKAVVDVQERVVKDGQIIAEKQHVDLMGDFYPFGPSPQPGDTFRLASRLFEKKGTRISIQVFLSPEYRPGPGEALSALKVVWEYCTADGQWKRLGLTTPAHVEISEHDFQDTTEAFTHHGSVKFRIPKDMAAFAQEGEPRFWIRARIDSGGYGENPPVVSSLRISFMEQERPFVHYWAENYLHKKDHTAQALKPEPFIPFEIDKDADPAFYMALDKPLDYTLQRVYFRLAEDFEDQNIDMFWEYSGPSGWQQLSLDEDSTGKLCHSGAIEFNGPADWAKTDQFGYEGYWLRARWVSGRWEKTPSLIGVHLNAVPVIQARTISDEVLGTGNGLPYQVFHFANRPVLPDPLIFVRELDDATEEQRQALAARMDKDDLLSPGPKGPGIWVRWQAVDNFYRSGPESRHFLLDLSKGTITFGNGLKGRIPPLGPDNILAGTYRIGGGAQGNVGAGCITVLESSFAAIQSVSNPEPATSGADAESVADARLRGPWMLKHRHRAVTLEDFEQLALEASAQVAKAKCTTDGKILTVVIIPKGEQSIPKPGVMLIQKVRDYLDRRRLVTTKLRIRGPDYLGVEIDTVVVLTPSAASEAHRLQQVMRSELNKFFHPISGGPDGRGWPMGRAVYLSEIYYLLEKIDGVDYVKSVTLNADTWRKRVAVGPCQYPFLKAARISII